MITTRDLLTDTRLAGYIYGIENRILELCDMSGEVTRSDLQSLVTVAAINIYNGIKNSPTKIT